MNRSRIPRNLIGTEKNLKQFRAEYSRPDQIICNQIAMFGRLEQGRDVKSVAQTLGESYLTLYRKFKQATGLAPKEYAREIRLARAEDLLAGTDLSVKEIAGRLGYYSASHLSLEFKKARGKSPSQWSDRT